MIDPEFISKEEYDREVKRTLDTISELERQVKENRDQVRKINKSIIPLKYILDSIHRKFNEINDELTKITRINFFEKYRNHILLGISILVMISAIILFI